MRTLFSSAFVQPLAATENIHGYLDLSPSQQEAINATLQAFTGARDHAMAVGRQLETASNAVIHRFCYRQLRETFGLSANLTVRAIACAARCLKEPTHCVEGAPVVEYDARTLSLGDEARTLSLSTVAGRVRDIDLSLTAGQRRRLQAGRVLRAVLSRPRQDRYVLRISILPRRKPSL